MQNGRDVLVVEDDGPTRSLLVAIVHRNGYRPVEAKDGRSAFVLLEAAKFRAVLLDLLLPEMSGLDILCHLIATNPEMLTRIAVITAALELTRRAEVKRARTVVGKPFEVQDVERALRLCCE
ncbi:MAG: hypothetical protein DMF56_12635 [Acidobacteria bacterium]|nr:MAG: hypothetical protein DMF56_12635 [Acidobacteriota bacterium]